MRDSPITRPSLLVRVRDARDGDAWTEFTRIYAPLVYAFGRRQGLQDADAADLTQDVLRTAVTAVRDFDYDRRRGSFRGWLFTVARNRLRDFWDRQKDRPRTTGDALSLEALEQPLASDTDQSQWWEQEYERRLYEYAAGQVRSQVRNSTWEAFRRTALEGQSVKAVAADLEMTVAAVYLAKGRVIERLKRCIRQLDRE